MAVTRKVLYREGNVEFHGHLACPDNLAGGSAPGILVAHAWGGQQDFEREYAERLADEGYVALAVDVYGEGKVGTSNDENLALMQVLLNDRALLRRRIIKALEALKELPEVDSDKTAGLGFCFGGVTVMDLARTGIDIAGVVSFHGVLAVPGDMRCESSPPASFLVLNGDADPMVDAESIADFQQEMRNAGADWQFVSYGGAMHSFTKPSANAPEMGMQYHRLTAERSWRSMLDFMSEILA